MKMLPNSEFAQVVRTDFSDQAAWDAIRAGIRTPDPQFGFVAYVEYIEDREYDGIDIAQLLTLVPADYNHSFIFLADREAVVLPDHLLLVVDFFSQPGKSFRVILPEVWAIENNLSIANMDFDDFADNVDPDGVFRGFPRL
jgi:hypothetical protein